MNNSFSETYFVDGGTLRANTPSYVKRPADDELFEALMAREYCYILTPRQMGKSSLMIHTSQRLKDQNIKTAIVDIQGIGSNKDREWYASLLSQIRRGLKLSVDIDEWMKKKSNVGLGQLFVDFVQDVVLAEISEQVVIFLDEVDWMIKIDFRDDFFASIRSIYNARAQYSEFNRISFVLLGVASPADLISEPTRTPFNIGHAIPLQELSLEEAAPLQDGLEKVCPGEGKRILKRVFYWTNGHPYLTQKLCKSVAESAKPKWADDDVDELVQKVFLSEESRKEANLKFIQDRILGNEQRVDLLKFYSRVLKTRIKDDSQSVLQKHLILSGLVLLEDGLLAVRNRIYQTVFSQRWIRDNLPRDIQRVAVITLGTTLGIIVLATLAIFINDFFVGSKVNGSIADFISASSPTQRLTDLANIYNQKGILSNTDSSLQAAQLFYGLSAKDQLAMFTDYAIDSSASLQSSLLTVIKHLYVTVADVDSANDNTQLLKTMRDSLNKVSNNSDALQFKKEITSWLDGRDQYHAGNYQAALNNYNSAIDLNSSNPATTYERAKVFIGLKQYDKALIDLDTTINLAKQATKQDEKDLTTPTITTPETSVATSTNAIIEKTASPSITPITTLSLTAVPLTKIPKATSTPSLNISPTSILPTVVPNTSIDRFKTNFTTFIEIVNAVRTLIDKNSALQDAIPLNGDITYINLNSVGLVKAYLRAPTSTPNNVAGPQSALGLTVQAQNANSPSNTVGQTIIYTYVVTNFGTTALAGPVTISDNKATVNCPDLTTVGNKDSNLDNGESVACTSAHTIDQTDLNTGSVTSQAAATVGGTNSSTVTMVVHLITSAGSGGGTPSNFTLGSTIQHSVVDGEWLVQIVRCYGADLNAVRNANPQVTDANASLIANTIVTIPNIGSNGNIYGPPCITYYTAQAGDTWNSIAQKYNADVLVLQDANSGIVLSNGITLKVPLNSSGSIQPQPSIGSTTISGKDGVTLVYIPSGTFTMGLTSEQVNTLRQLCSDNGCEQLYQASQPAHTVELTNGYWIYRTEVSNAQYAKCVNSGNCDPPSNPSVAYQNPAFANYPVIFVDWNKANAYCRWAGGRLPTSAEWEYAARGNDGRLFPWGNDIPDKNRANVNNFYGDIQPVDEYADSASPFGLLNMTGNVWEWVSDWYNSSYYKDNNNWINPQGPSSGNLKVGRGGSWEHPSAITSVAIQDWYDPTKDGSGVGFRCVIDVPG